MMMTIDTITRCAVRSISPPEEMTMPEALLYERIQNITAHYNSKMITKKEASEARIRATVDYTADCVTYHNGITAMARLAELYKLIELAASKYRINRDLDSADELLRVIDGGDLRKERKS